MTDRERRAWFAIQENARFARELVGSLSLLDFSEDRRAFYAATRCLEIISEASRRLRGDQQNRHPAIPWRQIEDAGNVFRHNYEGVQERRVWLAVVEELPMLLAAASHALKPEESLD